MKGESDYYIQRKQKNDQIFNCSEFHFKIV